MSRESDLQRQDDIEALRKEFPIGGVVHTVLRHVSKSGMTRAISVVAVSGGESYDLSYRVARVLGYKIDPRWGGLKVGGSGMDMGYHVAYSLSRALYSDGFPCTGEDHGPGRCPSNDHFNERERNYTPGRVHSDPGYALNHRWI